MPKWIDEPTKEEKREKVARKNLERLASDILHGDAVRRAAKEKAKSIKIKVLTDEQIRDGLRLTEQDLSVINGLPHNPEEYEQAQIRLAALMFKAKYTLEEKKAQEDKNAVVVTIKRAGQALLDVGQPEPKEPVGGERGPVPVEEDP